MTSVALRVLVVAGALAAVATPAGAEIANRLDRVAKPPVCTTWWNGPAPKPGDLKGVVTVLHVSDPTRTTSKAFVGTLRKLHRTYGDRGLQLVEVVVGVDEEQASEYVARGKIPWLVGLDGKGATEAEYPGSSVPRTYLVGPDGRVLWHAHVAALGTELIESQLTRSGFFDQRALPAEIRSAAKAAAKMAYAKALEGAAKVLEDPRAGDDAKTVATAIREDARFWFEFQFGLANDEIEKRDYGVGWARLERLAEKYGKTDYEERIKVRIRELEKWPVAVHVREGQRALDKALEKAGSRKKGDLGNALRSLQALLALHEATRVGERCKKWIAIIDKRLETMKR